MQQPAPTEQTYQNEYTSMKRITVITAFLLTIVTLSAQTDRFEQRYNLLVSRLGPAGVGIETLLDNWSKADSTSESLLKARFNYYYTKSQRQEVVKKPSKKYLGMDPLLVLKDSTGSDVCYYQETFYDDGLFGQAVKAADRAIVTYPDKIDYRFMKANAYVSYEKESPDMALDFLLELAEEDAARRKPWMFEGKETQPGFLADAMQEYCYSFWQIGTPQALKAFLILSETMSRTHPDNLMYMTNIGSYHMVAKEDSKTALKYYRKVLKKSPDDAAAIQNSAIAARKMGNAKLEAKFRKMLADKK